MEPSAPSRQLNTFNPEKRSSLPRTRPGAFENEILMYLRRNNKTRMEVSIDEPLNVDWDGNELLLSDILGTDEDVISRRLEDEVEISLLSKAIRKLSPREQTIIRLRFGLGKENATEKTQKEVADLWEFLNHIFPGWKKNHEETEKGNCEI